MKINERTDCMHEPADQASEDRIHDVLDFTVQEKTVEDLQAEIRKQGNKWTQRYGGSAGTVSGMRMGGGGVIKSLRGTDLTLSVIMYTCC